MFDVLITGGQIVDGSGKSWFKGDVGIKGEKIEAIGDLKTAQAKKVINVNGLAVTPGFIDVHTHSDHPLLVTAQADSMVRQGVTTQVIGNCGHSCAPVQDPDLLKYVILGYDEESGVEVKWRSFSDYLDQIEEFGCNTNIVPLVGHNAIRLTAMGLKNREARPEEVGKMKAILAQCFEEGAFGLSTGLEYVPGKNADNLELLELCKLTAEHNRLYATHIRNRDFKYLESVDETLELAKLSGVAVQFSHLTSKFGATSEAIEGVFRSLNKAREQGLDVTCDTLPYRSGPTTATALLPPWILEGGAAQIIGRLQQEKYRQQVKDYKWPIWKIILKGKWDEITLRRSKMNPQYVSKTFAEIAEDRKKEPWDAIMDIFVEEGEDLFSLIMTAEITGDDILLALKDPFYMIGSDGFNLMAHGPLSKLAFVPSSFGWAPRVLEKWVKEEKIISLEEAIRKMTSFTAQRFGITDRGLLKPGMCADLVIFDFNKIKENATPEKPSAYATGLDYVFVNGKLAVERDHYLGTTSGTVLRKK